MKRALLLFGVMVILGSGGVWGVRAWRQEVLLRQEARAFAKAQELLKGGEPLQALVLQQTQVRPNSKLDWPRIQLESLAGLRDVARLSQLFERESSRVLAHEEASLLVARGYLHTRRPAEAEKVRNAWRGREIQKGSWLVLDSDALVLGGKTREAENLLRSISLPGAEDEIRLTRLAVLVARTNLTAAWGLLGKATELNPKDADLRLFRAQVMEATGRMEAARFEYAAAVIARTNDAFLRDELAEFYRRQGKITLAQQTWMEVMPDRAPDYFWLKAGFWGKMISPVKWDAKTVAVGDLKPLVEWLIQLPAERYFDTNSFARLTGNQRYQATRQELHWLELMDALQRGDEQGAAVLLGYSKFRANSWEADLEVALLRILQYRFKQTFKVSTAGLSPVGGTNQHQFFIDLAKAAATEAATGKAALSSDLERVLRGPDAFVAAFLAAGWREAALQLHKAGHSPKNHPMWLSYGLAECLRSNRGTGATLEFLEQQASAPELDLLKGEVQIQASQLQEGLATLRKVADARNGIGQRATYILALADLDQKNYLQARQRIQRHPMLAGATMGQELLGRAAMGEGHPDEADKIYSAIAGASVEARTHLARRAYSRKDWAAARRYTMELLTLMPDQLQLRENLIEIERASGGK